MPELLDGQTVISAGPALDKAAADAQFEKAMVTTPAGDLPLRPEPGAPDDGSRPRRGRKPRAEQPRVTGAAPGRSALGHDARVTGLKGLAQVGAGILALGGRATGSTALLADALVITDNAGGAAEAVAQMCDTDPRFAAVIDKVCAAGPWSGLITVGVTIGTQVLRNHRPALQLPGTVHPDELLRRAAEQQQLANAA